MHHPSIRRPQVRLLVLLALGTAVAVGGLTAAVDDGAAAKRDRAREAFWTTCRGLGGEPRETLSSYYCLFPDGETIRCDKRTSDCRPVPRTTATSPVRMPGVGMAPEWTAGAAGDLVRPGTLGTMAGARTGAIRARALRAALGRVSAPPARA